MDINSANRNVRRKALLAVPLAGLLAALALGGTAYAYNAQELTDMATGGEAVAFPGDEYLEELDSYWDQIAEDYAPEVITLEDGRKVQRTPSEFDVGAWQKFSDTISYNTYYLDGDHRGCASCHGDLKDVVSGMDYHHPVVWNYTLGNNLGVQQCLLCHGETMGYVKDDHQFGTLIHALHYSSRYGDSFDALGGNCYSCHNATDDGMGMQLWDLVKYDLYYGMNPVAADDVDGQLALDQDKVLSVDEMFSLDWMHTFYDNLRGAAGKNGADLPLDQELFDTWTITIDGTVAEPYTENLTTLIAEAEEAGVVVTKPSKIHCDWDPIGGAMISNVEITGIPVSWLIERAGGYTDGTTGVHVVRADESSHRAFPLDKLGDSYLVYKIGGEDLTWSTGFPCMNWTEGVDAQIYSKQINHYEVTAEDLDYAANIPCGWIAGATSMSNGGDASGAAEDVQFTNKPNTALLHLPDGLIVKTGEPYTFEGVSDAYDEAITAIEISLDNGETWVTYDLGQTDPFKWTYWTFTWTPPQEGAYTISARAVTETGRTQTEWQTIMFNAKDVVE